MAKTCGSMVHVATLPIMTMTQEPATTDEPGEEIELAETHGHGLSRRLNAKEKALRALEMKRRRYTWEDIAREVGYANGKTAAAAAKRMLDSQERETVEDYKRMMIDRCAELMVALTPKADAGNERAVDATLKVMDRMDKYMGIGPVVEHGKVEVTHTLVIEGSTEERYVEQLAALAPPMQAGSGEPMPEGAVPNPFVDDVVEGELPILDAEVID